MDWSTLTVIPEADQDGEATAIVDEDIVFEAMGFKAADERAQEAVERAIPVIPPEVQNDMDEVGINVDDTEPTELVLDWDRNNPDMMVGTVYPTMTDFRMAVRQHAIVHEFELGTEKSDKTRFKGFGKPLVVLGKLELGPKMMVLSGYICFLSYAFAECFSLVECNI